MQSNYETLTGLPAILPSTCLLPILLYALFRLAFSIRTDYQSFLSLGPGGTPSTPWGWWRLKRLSLFTLSDVYSPPPIPSYLHPRKGYLHDLPLRAGPRPIVRGIAPQRQTTQLPPASSQTFSLLCSHLRALAAANPRHLVIKTSFLERHTIALFARPNPSRSSSSSFSDSSLFAHEICHPHHLDSSMHLMLHPADVSTVIMRGWGERHPLARGDWWWKLYFQQLGAKGRPPVPENMVLVYAPRDEGEVEAVKMVVGAAVGWAVGVEGGKGGMWNGDVMGVKR